MSNENAPESGASQDFMRADKVSTKRAMTLYALGVVTGLVLGGIGLFNARGTVTNKVPEEMLALVNQRPILRSDFVTQLENETGMPLAETTRQDQLRVLDEMLREELFVQRGLELNFAETDQDTRSALYNIVEQQVLAGVNLGKASDKDLHEYYDKHHDQFMKDGQLEAFDDVRNVVQSFYYSSEKVRVMSNMMTFLRSRSAILIADDFKNDYKPEDFAGGN